jgi:TRAP-type uncharacterized transport system fused permease subunit
VRVPFAFVFSPSQLVTKDFAWSSFTLAFIGCALGIVSLEAALSRFMLVCTRA